MTRDVRFGQVWQHHGGVVCMAVAHFMGHLWTSLPLTDGHGKSFNHSEWNTPTIEYDLLTQKGWHLVEDA